MNKNIKSLVIIVLAVLFTTLSANVNVLAIDEENNESKIIVSLGDSYSAGEGIDDFYDSELPIKDRVKSKDWLAHRSKESWPGKLTLPSVEGEMSKHRDDNWYFVAASGATTYDITDQQQKPYYKKSGLKIYTKDDEYLPAQIDVFNKLEEKNQKADYVTLTIGGNDADFTEVVTEAAMNSTYNKYLFPSKLTDMINQIWGRFFKDYYNENNEKQDSIQKRIKSVYETISERAGEQATIIVAGYPRLFAENSDSIIINPDEAKIINENVSEFNYEISRIVEKCQTEGMNITFVSVEEAFAGKEAYSIPEDESYINKIIIPSKEQDLLDLVQLNGIKMSPIGLSADYDYNFSSAYSMHPNGNGATFGYAKCVQDKIDELEGEKASGVNSVSAENIGNNNSSNANNEYAENYASYERDVVLVLDTSGSMSGTPIDETKTAATKFVDTVLNQGAKVGIVEYSSSASAISQFSSDASSLINEINELNANGGTNIGDGLSIAEGMLSNSTAKKKIIVLMSDGEPNTGKVDEELIAYADELKEKDIYIYTLGFFESLDDKTQAQYLMEKIANEGCHYEVSDADSLVYFFGDVADQINGQKFIYVRIACPVDVSVSFNGETLDSSNLNRQTRTSFGSLTFEQTDTQASNGYNSDYDSYDSDNDHYYDDNGMYAENNPEKIENDTDPVKILRLKEGENYDIEIYGTGKGRMNYSIGFMDENGEYTDFRRFNNIKITRNTEIDTVAEVSDKTVLNVDEDGDGKYDLTYEARANERGKVVDNSFIVYLILSLVGVLILLILILIIYIKVQKYKRNKLRRG